MYINPRSLLTAGSLLPTVLAAKIPRQVWNNGSPSPLPPSSSDEFDDVDAIPPPPSNYYGPSPGPPPPGWGPPPGWIPPGWAPPPPGPPPQNFEPHADQAWGIVFGRGPNSGASFQPVFSPSALTFINLFDECGDPGDWRTCTDVGLCELGVVPFCQLHGRQLGQFRTDLCNLGLAGVCPRSLTPGRTPAGTAFTWGLMVGGIQPNGTSGQLPPPPNGPPNGPPPHHWPPPPHWPPPAWPTVTVTTTWISTQTAVSTEIDTSTQSTTSAQSITSIETDVTTQTQTMMITTTQIWTETQTQTQTQTLSFTNTVTTTFIPPPPRRNSTEDHIFEMGLSLQAALVCTGHEASDRCKDSDFCAWGFDLFCSPHALPPRPNGSALRAPLNYGVSNYAGARQQFKNRLCHEGIGIFCNGGDVDKEGEFLMEVMRAVAKRLSAEHGHGPPPSPVGARLSGSQTSATVTATPTLRNEIEAALRPAPSGMVWGAGGKPMA